MKIRGTAAHIAEKYVSLARDSLSVGDVVQAENYLQHAEHYNRIIMAAQPQYSTHGQPQGEAPNGAGGPRQRVFGLNTIDEDESEDGQPLLQQQAWHDAPPPREGEPQPRDPRPRDEQRPPRDVVLRERDVGPRERGDGSFDRRRQHGRNEANGRGRGSSTNPNGSVDDTASGTSADETTPDGALT